MASLGIPPSIPLLPKEGRELFRQEAY